MPLVPDAQFLGMVCPHQGKKAIPVRTYKEKVGTSSVAAHGLPHVMARGLILSTRMGSVCQEEEEPGEDNAEGMGCAGGVGVGRIRSVSTCGSSGAFDGGKS